MVRDQRAGVSFVSGFGTQTHTSERTRQYPGLEIQVRGGWEGRKGGRKERAASSSCGQHASSGCGLQHHLQYGRRGKWRKREGEEGWKKGCDGKNK